MRRKHAASRELETKSRCACVLAVCHRPHLSPPSLFPSILISAALRKNKIHGGANIFTDMGTKELGQWEAVSSQRLRF